MKKLLALVLALVMTLSLCVTSNAAYSDAADIDYDEAVEVMSAIGVLQGSDGKFNPDGILTREQAAKIVTYLLLGKSAADALVTIAAPFADVAADRWSAGSIAYCYNEGILAGVGEGKFDPAGQLTGLAFAKMMLTALGYDAEQEGLTGSQWSINVAKMALSLDLTDGMEEVVLSQPMSRQQAAQMALNVLETMTVKYPQTSTITAGNVTIKTNTTAQNDGVFMGKYWPKLDVDHSEKTDFKAPATTWTYKNEEVGTYADKADATFAGKVTYGQLYTAIGSTAVKNLNTLTVYVDGYEVADEYNGNTTDSNCVNTDLIKKGEDDAFNYFTTYASSTFSGKVEPTGNGVKTEVFVDEHYYNGNFTGKYDVQINIVNTYIGKINKVNAETAKADRNVQITNKSAAMTLANSGKFETEEFAKDDYVLFTATYNNTNSNYTIQSAKLAEKVAAVEISSYKTGTSFVADGETYKYSKKCDAAVEGIVVLGDQVDLYLDNDGFVAYGETFNAATNYENYLVITKAAAQTTLNDTIIANAVTMDGQLLSGITLGKCNSTKIDDATDGNDFSWNTIYSFSVDSNNKYNLKTVATPYGTVKLDGQSISVSPNTYKFYNGYSAVGDANGAGVGVACSDNTAFKATTATKFVVYNNDKNSVTVYDGIKNMVNIKNDATLTSVNALYKTAGTATLVFVNTNKTNAATATAKDLVYLLDTDYSVSKPGDDDLYTYSAIVNGKVTTITAKDYIASSHLTNATADQKLYYVSEYEGDYVKAMAAVTNGTPEKYSYVLNSSYTEVKYADGVVSIDTNNYVLDDACAIYSITDDGEVTEVTVDDLATTTTTNEYTLVQVERDGAKYVTAIYIQKTV